jgi:hypothetical protein
VSDHKTSSRVFLVMPLITTGRPMAGRTLIRYSVTRAGCVVSRFFLYLLTFSNLSLESWNLMSTHLRNGMSQGFDKSSWNLIAGILEACVGNVQTRQPCVDNRFVQRRQFKTKRMSVPERPMIMPAFCSFYSQRYGA